MSGLVVFLSQVKCTDRQIHRQRILVVFSPFFSLPPWLAFSSVHSPPDALSLHCVLHVPM